MRIDHGNMDGALIDSGGGTDAGSLPPGTAAQVPEIVAEAAIWAGFASPRSAIEFCESWLSLQCRNLTGAARGVLLLREDGGRYTPAAVWPNRRTDVTHLAAAAQDALGKHSGTVTTKEGSAQVAYPIEVSGIIEGVVVVELAGARPDQLTAALRQLHWGAGWLETLFHRREVQRSQLQLRRNDLTLDMLASAAEHSDQREAGAAVTTQLATQLNCNRVSLGLARGKTVKLLAISHQATFQEKAQIIDAIENAMEECLDQDSPVAHPPTSSTGRRISLAHQDLARRAGARAVASVPLISAGQAVGVLTLERETDTPFTDEELASLEAVSAALGPLVEARMRSQRLIAGSAIDTAESWLQKLFGPRRPGIKLAAIAVAAFVGWLSVARDEFRVSAKTAIEGTVQRSAVAPFDGFVATAPVRAGQEVEEGQVLATLDQREIALEAGRWRAEREQQMLKYQEALGKQDRVQARIIAAQVQQAEAQLALLEAKLERSVIKAPFKGLVVSGDLSQMLGSPVETGKLLFEVAPLNSYRAVLQVEERDAAYIKEGQTGTIRLTGQASMAVSIRVTKVVPVANAADGRNTFRAEAALLDAPPWVRPGMEGVAKVAINEQPLAWIWTRTMVDWVRLSVWSWMP